MGDAMTLAAVCKVVNDGLGVGRRVAFLAGRDGLVLGGMALRA